MSRRKIAAFLLHRKLHLKDVVFPTRQTIEIGGSPCEIFKN